jgi:serine/threonine protein phosphatase 1
MRPPNDARRAATAPDGTVIFAIGDVHGRVDLLARATRAIEAQAAETPKRTVAIFLGDYIDRGPGSREVVKHLIALKTRAPFELTFLRGNHEQVLLDLVAGKEDTPRWLAYGGRETLASYGAALPARGAPSAPALREIALKAIPPEHLQFLAATELMRVLGDYVFVHAGLKPDRLIEEQSEADMLWLRPVAESPPLWAETVVHGHTPHPMPFVGPWRIGIDTGAFVTGALTLLRLEGEKRSFLKAVAHEGDGDVGLAAWEATLDNPDAGLRAPAESGRPLRAFWRRWAR